MAQYETQLPDKKLLQSKLHEFYELAQEQAEVVTGGGEDGIDAIAVAAHGVIASHRVLGFDMTDDRLDIAGILTFIDVKAGVAMLTLQPNS